MVRSNLTTKFHLNTVNKFQKAFRQDNEDAKKKNIARYITVDVINRKGVPDIEDCVLLIKLGNTNCDDEQAYDILQRWLDNDDNKARGIAGAFCELCKDYCIDIPVDGLHKKQCEQLEEIINSRLEAQDKLSNLLSQLTNLKDKIEQAQNKIENTDVVQDVPNSEQKELGVQNEDTQE
jgi:hypothetical protein